MKPIMNVVRGTVRSRVSGSGLALAHDRLDPAVKGAAEARRITALPILADTPS